MKRRLGGFGFFGSVGLLGSLAAACLTGCGASRTAASVHGGASEAPVAAPPAPAGYAGSGRSAEASESAAPRSEPYSGDSYEKSRDEERPGLGTEWGEQLDSRVSTTSFARASGDSPNGVASIFYNDEDGIRAASRGRYVDWTDTVVPVAGGNVTVSLTDTSGAPLRAARFDGRTIALGNDGDRYVVRVENHSSVRVETVATVDGLDVVDGGDGDFHKRGYVIAPYDTLEIQGFRESEGSVRAFRFGTVSDSYAARRGKDRNVGVIGVAVFRERGPDWRWTPEEVERRETADPFPGRFAPAPPSRW